MAYPFSIFVVPCREDDLSLSVKITHHGKGQVWKHWSLVRFFCVAPCPVIVVNLQRVDTGAGDAVKVGKVWQVVHVLDAGQKKNRFKENDEIVD